MIAADSAPTEPGTPRPVAGTEPVLEVSGIDPEDVDYIKRSTQTILQGGCGYFDDIIESLCDQYGVGKDGIPGITSLVESGLQELLSEQAEWPEDEMKHMKSLTRAFRVLEQNNIVSRANFSCCNSCGNGEIQAEASSQHVGYCYFHHQDLNACIEDNGGLYLRYGVIGDDVANLEKKAEIARILIHTMEEVGLNAEWNGDPLKVVSIPDFKWRVRLHDIRWKGEERQGEDGEAREELGVGNEDEGDAEAEEDERTGLGMPLADVYIR